jgi:hypothetical protein
LQQQIWCYISKQCEFWPRFGVKVPILDTARLKLCHGLTPISHQMLFEHPNNIQGRYVHDMK